MLSLLIPTYNYVCAHLVCELQKQCEEVQAMLGQDFKYEIIVGDDASTDNDTVNANAVVDALPCCRYEWFDENYGRARHRNRMIAMSRYPWLLLIDSDAEVVSDDFIWNYWQAAQRENAGDIIVGSILTPPTAPAGHELRLNYEHWAEGIRTLEVRQANPVAYLSTFNLLIRRNVLERQCFDERCTQYGYEDALFGIEAERNGFRIQHIDNPLLHRGINDNASFLRNSELALETLHHLGSPMTDRANICKAVRKVEEWHLPGWKACSAATLLLYIYKGLKPALKRNLLSRHPNLKLFAFYKLGYYLELQTEKKQ